MIIKKEFGLKRLWPNRGTIHAFPFRDRRESTKPTVRIAHVPAQIPTNHLTNKSKVRYRHASPFGHLVKHST
jgi:hypothetical protein